MDKKWNKGVRSLQSIIHCVYATSTHNNIRKLHKDWIMSFSVNALITRSLEEKDSKFLFAFPMALYNQTEQVWIKYIREYVEEYKQLPILERFTQQYPTFRTETVDRGIPTRDIFQTLIPKAQESYLSHKIGEDALKGKTVWTPEYLNELLADVTPTSTDLLEFTKMTKDQFVKERKLYDWGDGAKWMQKLVGKLDHKDFIVISGVAKSAKTTILSILAVSLFKQGYTILMFNNELDKFFMAGKILAILKKFNPNVFRSMEFTEEILTKFEEFEDEMKNYQNQIYVHGRISSITDVISDYNNCEIKPDIIMVDAFNNMGGKNAANQSDKSVSLGNMAKHFRDFCNDFGIPIIATSQLNRSGGQSNTPDQSAIGDTIELIRQTDHAFTTTVYNADPVKIHSPIAQRFASKYPNTDMPFFYINTMVSRHGGSGAVCIHIDWDTMQMLIAEPSLIVREDLMERIREEELKEVEAIQNDFNE
jgi:hypothetical protein